MIDQYPYSLGTNASGAIRSNAAPVCAWLVGSALFMPGTSSVILNEQPYMCDEGTGTGFVLINPENAVDKLVRNQHADSADQAIMELRRLSGLTWDQVARIFDVNRRSVHFWASGKAMTQSHEEKLYSVLSVIRKIDRGSAASNRSALLSCDSNGVSPLDMLRDTNFAGVIDAIGISESTRTAPATIASSEFERRKIPASPQQLLGALHDNVHEEIAPRQRVAISKIRKK